MSRPSYLRSLSSITLKNKSRLYLALYPRGIHGSTLTCDAYHWAIVIGPSTSSREDDIERFHLVHPRDTPMTTDPAATASYFEEDNLQENQSARGILVRVAVAKVLDVGQARKILRSLSPRRQDEYHTCFTWVKEAFGALHAESGCLKTYFNQDDWMFMERSAREYVKQKRLEGRFAEDTSPLTSTEICTYTAWEKRETTP